MSKCYCGRTLTSSRSKAEGECGVCARKSVSSDAVKPKGMSTYPDGMDYPLDWYLFPFGNSFTTSDYARMHEISRFEAKTRLKAMQTEGVVATRTGSMFMLTWVVVV